MIANGRAVPLPYQKEGIRLIEKFGGRSLLSDEMGLGKTLQTLWTLKRNPTWFPALVVCPATVKYNWQHEAGHHVGIHASVCEGQTPPPAVHEVFTDPPKLTIINYDILKHWLPYFKGLGLRTVVFDECQNLQNPRTHRTRAAKTVARGCPQVLALSGTPLTNRPRELYPVLNILWPTVYKSFFSFAQEFCAPKRTPWGWDYGGATNLDVLHGRLKQHGMIRRRKADVLKDLPDKVRRVVPCDLTDRKQYNEASTDFMGWLSKHKAEKVRAASRAEALARIGYLLRLSAKLKMRAVVDWANQFLEETDEKLVLFAVHRKAIDVLRRRCNAQSVVVDGSVTGRIRQMTVRQFQEDDRTRLFIGNIKAAGVGITLTAASTVGFAEMYWRPGDHIQAEDRIHRIGQTQVAWVNYLVAGDTLEERLCEILQNKQRVISSVLDGGPTPADLNIYAELLETLKGEV